MKKKKLEKIKIGIVIAYLFVAFLYIFFDNRLIVALQLILFASFFILEEVYGERKLTKANYLILKKRLKLYFENERILKAERKLDKSLQKKKLISFIAKKEKKKVSSKELIMPKEARLKNILGLIKQHIFKMVGIESIKKENQYMLLWYISIIIAAVASHIIKKGLYLGAFFTLALLVLWILCLFRYGRKYGKKEGEKDES